MRLDEFGLRDGQALVERLRQAIREHSGNELRFPGVDRDGKRARVPIVTVNRARSFPDAIGMARQMIFVTDEENFRPEIGLQAVLGLDDGQIIAGGNDAAVEDDEVVFSGNENDFLGLAGAQRERKGESHPGEPAQEGEDFDLRSHLWVL